jgi:hypothetical protein
MPSTLVLIQKQVVGASGAASVTFSSIPQTYTDLVLRVSSRDTSAATIANMYVRFNGDSGSNYTDRMLYASGTSVSSGVNSGTGIYYTYSVGANGPAGLFSNNEVIVGAYTGSAYKAISIENSIANNSTGGLFGLNSGMWNSTSAVTSVTFTPGSGNFAQYTTISLYGVKATTATTYQYNSIPAVLNVGDIINVPYTGTSQTLALPANVKSVQLTVAGARGGATSSGTSYGKGAAMSGIYTFGTGVSRTIYAYVGGNGTNLATTGSGSVAGGFNGGGNGWYASYSGAEGYAGAGGGGATDIRVGGTALANRVIVAGGGGGKSGAGDGGDAGYPAGTKGLPASVGTFNGQGGGAGTQSAGGVAGGQTDTYSGNTLPTAGSLGNGGNGGNTNSYGCGGGGGGGYYGGGGGGGHYNGSGGGGGGGSSYYDPSMTNINAGLWYGSAYAQIMVTGLGY